MKVLLIAGERSGELLLVRYVLALIEQFPEVECYCQVSSDIYREHLQELPQTHWLFDASLCHVMGFIEPLKRLPSLFWRREQICHWISAHKPQYVLGFDSPDFMLPIEQYARKKGAYSVHIVSPSIWAWRPGRAQVVGQSADELHVLFDFEKHFYDKTPLHVEHIGHPLLEQVEPQKRSRPVKRLLLLPGSRQAEVSNLLPLFLSWARTLKIKGYIQEISAVFSPGIELPPFTLTRDIIQETDFHEAISRADLALVCSGTASLQVAAQGCPLVVFYDIPLWKKTLFSLIVATRWVGLPNIVHQSHIVQEFVGDLSARYAEIENYLENLMTPEQSARLANQIYDKMSDLVKKQKSLCLKSLIKRLLQRGSTKPVAAL